MKTNKLYTAIPLMLVSSFVFSIGMGEIRVESFINQPFSAEIPLLDVGVTQLSSIKASLATPDEFDRIGIEQPSIFLPAFKFDVVKNRNGQPVIKISSIDRVSEPYVQILVDLAWPKGEIYRTYTVLLDPPGYKLLVSGNNGTSSYKKFVTRGRTNGSRNTNYAVATTRLETPEFQPKDVVYGPTQVNENIWQISQRYSVSGTTLQQIILAIAGTNSQAFTQGNLNGLKIGERLRIPSTEEVLKVPVELARQEVDAHDLAWKSRQEIRHVLLPPYINGVVGVSQFDQDDSDNDSLPSIITQTPQLVQDILELPTVISNVPFVSASSSQPEKGTVPAISYLPPVLTVADNANSLSLRKQLADMQEKNNQLEKALLQKNKDFKTTVLPIHSSDKVVGKQIPEIKAKPVATETSSNFWLYLLLLSGLAGGGAFAYRMRQAAGETSRENGMPQTKTEPLIGEPVPTEIPVDETLPLESTVGNMVSVDDSSETPVSELLTADAAIDTIIPVDDNRSVSVDESSINPVENSVPIDNEESINNHLSDNTEVPFDDDNSLEYEPGLDKQLPGSTSSVIAPVITTEPDNSLEYSIDSMDFSPTSIPKDEPHEPLEQFNDEIVFEEEPGTLEKEAQSDSVEQNPFSPDKPPKLVKSKPALDTLLALAKTYISMDDYESAKQSLNELLAFGDDNQKEEAQKLIDEINNKS